MPVPERRVLKTSPGPIELRAAASGPGTLVGYGAVFYNASDPGTTYSLWEGLEERIMPGAFDRAIREDDVRGLFNHEADHLLGRTKSGTMRLLVDSKGLRYEIDLPDTTSARDVAASAKRGDLSGSSFSFTTTDEEWVKEGGMQVRLIKGVQLFDVGPVTFPAYEATTTEARDEIRARAAKALAPAADDGARERRARDLDLRAKS